MYYCLFYGTMTHPSKSLESTNASMNQENVSIKSSLQNKISEDKSQNISIPLSQSSAQYISSSISQDATSSRRHKLSLGNLSSLQQISISPSSKISSNVQRFLNILSHEPNSPLPSPLQTPSSLFQNYCIKSLSNLSISPTESLLMLSSHHSGLVVHISNKLVMCETFHYYRSLMRPNPVNILMKSLDKESFEVELNTNDLIYPFPEESSSFQNKSHYQESNTSLTRVEEYKEKISRSNNNLDPGCKYITIGDHNIIEECRHYWNLQNNDENIIRDIIIRCGHVCIDDEILDLKRRRKGPEPWPVWTKLAQQLGYSKEYLQNIPSKEILEIINKISIEPSESLINSRNKRKEWEEQFSKVQKNRKKIRKINPEITYHIPNDNSTITLNEDHLSEPFEIFFDSSSGFSIANLILESLLKCPIDARLEVSQNIILSGFIMDVPGFKTRIFKEIKYLIESNRRYKPLQALYNSFRVYQTQIPGDQMVQIGRDSYLIALNDFLKNSLHLNRFQNVS